MRRIGALVVGVGLAVTLGGCGGDGTSSGAASPPRATVTVTTGGAPSSATPSTRPVSLPPPVPRDARHVEQVVSPSGNIVCTVRPVIDCVITQADYDDLPRPHSCIGDWNDHDFTVGRDRGVRGSCRTDTPFRAKQSVLAYGDATILDGHACQSEETGMTCWDTTTSHGFLIARAGYTLF
jgi:uncharacterized protein DUF6636